MTVHVGGDAYSVDAQMSGGNPIALHLAINKLEAINRSPLDWHPARDAAKPKRGP